MELTRQVTFVSRFLLVVGIFAIFFSVLFIYSAFDVHRRYDWDSLKITAGGILLVVLGIGIDKKKKWAWFASVIIFLMCVILPLRFYIPYFPHLPLVDAIFPIFDISVGLFILFPLSPILLWLFNLFCLISLILDRKVFTNK